jgi:signal peptidase I
MVRRIATGLGLVIAAFCVVVALGANHSYVTTPSMYPTIPPGSEIFVQAAPSYHVGDVIEFRGNGLVWAHRLVAIKPDGSYVTKGDNPENAPDVFIPAIRKGDVIGKVVFAPHWLGFPELILHHPAYGLSWLRTELGVPGRVGLVLLAGLLTLVPGTRRSGHGRDLRAPQETAERDASDHEVTAAGPARSRA